MERSRSSERSSSGAVEMRLRIWLMAWVRLRRAEDRATRNTRMASTFPVLVLADPLASPPCAARAAATASSGSDLPWRRRLWRLGRSTSTTEIPWRSRWRVSPAP